MQISAEALQNATLLRAIPDDAGPYEVPRSLVLALNGAEQAQADIIQHLRDTGQVQQGDVIDVNWPAEP